MTNYAKQYKKLYNSYLDTKYKAKKKIARLNFKKWILVEKLIKERVDKFFGFRGIKILISPMKKNQNIHKYFSINAIGANGEVLEAFTEELTKEFRDYCKSFDDFHIVGFTGSYQVGFNFN